MHLKAGTAKLKEDCDVMIDQIRAIDNKRLIKRVGELPESIRDRIKENVTIVLDL